MAKSFELNINAEVIAQMAEMAALETEGVAALAAKPVDLHAVFKKNVGTKSVNVVTDSGIIKVEVFITVDELAPVQQITERVQENIKEKIQGMTGKAVTRVDVVVCDVVFAPEESKQ